LLQVENDAVPLEGQRHHHHRHQQHEFLSQPTLEDTQERLDKLQLNQDKEEKTAEANSDSLSSTEGQQDSYEAGQVRIAKNNKYDGGEPGFRIRIRVGSGSVCYVDPVLDLGR
jgi:hypothetical protein